MPTTKSEGLMSKITDIQDAWQKFVQSWTELANEKGFPIIESDSDWPSECEFKDSGTDSGATGSATTRWKPVLIESPLSFDNVGEALDITVDEQYNVFFTSYFSDGLNARHEKGDIQFLQAWSIDDFERLQQNLIGHLLMKKKLKQEPTLFFAVTDEDDLNLVVKNSTGEVCLEYVGKEPHEVVAPDLTSFIEQCKPVL